MRKEDFAPIALEFITFIAKRLLDQPDAFKCEIVFGEETMQFYLSCDKSDFGKLVGKKGANINALRTLFLAMASPHKQKTTIIVKEP